MQQLYRFGCYLCYFCIFYKKRWKAESFQDFQKAFFALHLQKNGSASIFAQKGIGVLKTRFSDLGDRKADFKQKMQITKIKCQDLMRARSCIWKQMMNQIAFGNNEIDVFEI